MSPRAIRDATGRPSAFNVTPQSNRMTCATADGLRRNTIDILSSCWRARACGQAKGSETAAIAPGSARALPDFAWRRINGPPCAFSDGGDAAVVRQQLVQRNQRQAGG
jgi:hypothetical protein